jgi:NAD(P)-dependent dehydrogenase (short-subunit alcohol dehydrogenase family)
MDLAGKRCVITGASSGIGLAAAKAFAERGARVLAVARKIESIERASIPGVTALSCDLSSREGVDALFAEANDLLGGVDVFFANAGFAYCERTDTPDWTKSSASSRSTSLRRSTPSSASGPRRGRNPFYFLTTRRDEPHGPAGYAVYGATKAAAHMFGRTAAFELSKGQRIATVYPVATRPPSSTAPPPSTCPGRPRTRGGGPGPSSARWSAASQASIPSPSSAWRTRSSRHAAPPQRYLRGEWRKNGLALGVRTMSGAARFLTDPADPSTGLPPLPLPGTSKAGLHRPQQAERGFRLASGAFAGGMPERGSLGALMLVDYRSSGRGPLPRAPLHAGQAPDLGREWHRSRRSTCRRWRACSTAREWAIPKERADFELTREGRDEFAAVSLGGRPFFTARFRAGGPRFPVSTALLPFPLLQGEEGRYLQTIFSGRGSGRLASAEVLEADQEFFPDLSLVKPLAAIAVDPFRITFPWRGRWRTGDERRG